MLPPPTPPAPPDSSAPSDAAAGASRSLSPSPSMSTLGRMRSIHFGSHQARSPSRNIVAGMIIMRTTKASKTMAAARAKPMVLMKGMSCRAKAAKTLVMISAAAVTTRAPCLNPLAVALPAVLPWW